MGNIASGSEPAPRSGAWDIHLQLVSHIETHIQGGPAWVIVLYYLSLSDIENILSFLPCSFFLERPRIPQILCIPQWVFREILPCSIRHGNGKVILHVLGVPIKRNPDAIVDEETGDIIVATGDMLDWSDNIGGEQPSEKLKVVYGTYMVLSSLYHSGSASKQIPHYAMPHCYGDLSITPSPDRPKNGWVVDTMLLMDHGQYIGQCMWCVMPPNQNN